MKHSWRAVIPYALTDEEARQLVQGYGHPEVDEAPVTLLATAEQPPVGDPRVFLGTHNMIKEDVIVACWNCEEGWTPEIASQPCSGESPLAGMPSLSEGPPVGNVPLDNLVPVGRNDPCPCGSGLKFKRCHGAS